MFLEDKQTYITPPTIRQAILKAADHIERHPDLFDFLTCDIPEAECGMPGCAIGWIAFYSQNFDGRDYGLNDFTMMHMDTEAATFYERMDSISNYAWTGSAKACASALREYAKRHHAGWQIG